MIKITLDSVAVELTETTVKAHESDVRKAAVEADYASTADAIWDRVVEWAEAWEQYPNEETVLDGYPALVKAVASEQHYVTDSAELTAMETMGQHILDLKEAWVNISLDPTEASQLSSSLDAVTNALWRKLDEIQSYDGKSVLNSLLPKVFTLSNDFLNNKFDCHQNAAKAVKAVFDAFPFQKFLEGSGGLSENGKFMVTQWDQLAWSSRI
jgi:hypothetical protein